jgi:hypothetical protein
VTAFSVFTHINEPEIAWLLELRRILKIGGIACNSVHDEATWQNPVPLLRDTILRSARRSPIFPRSQNRRR